MPTTRFLLVLTTVVLLGSLLGNGAGVAHANDRQDADPVIVTFATADGSTFRTVLEQPADIAAARAALAGDGNAGIPNGVLAHGDGGVNAPHAWHMVDTTLADFTIELCDATATMVDADVDYWVETVGRFCPWNTTVVDIEPVADPGPGPIIRQILAVLLALLAALQDGQ